MNVCWEPRLVVEGYRLVRQVAETGMAQVWEATGPADGRFALKRLYGGAASLAKRFRREGQIQLGLQHPNVLGLHAFLDTPEGLVLAQEFVDGGDLRRYLERGLPDRGIAAPIVEGVLQGMVYVHERGVVHRDLKPENILLASSGEGWVPRVTDFGLARAEDGGGLTILGHPFGTLGYMSPEQLRGEADIGYPTDVFALGCVIYEVFTGRRLYDLGAEDGALSRYQETLKRPADLRLLPSDLRAAVARAIDPNPRARFPTARELLAAFRGEEVAPHALGSAESFVVERADVEAELQPFMGTSGPRLFAAWQGVRARFGPGQEAWFAVARNLIAMQRPELAMVVLDDCPPGVLCQQLRALAHARSNQDLAAQAILQRLVDQGHDDAETLGLLAGRYKRRWLSEGLDLWRDNAHFYYALAFQRHGDPYTGINAAALAFERGQHAEGRRLAAESIAKIPAGATDHWSLATRAEGASLLGERPQRRCGSTRRQRAWRGLGSRTSRRCGDKRVGTRRCSVARRRALTGCCRSHG